jgi:AcrR family transcriptional regulator
VASRNQQAPPDTRPRGRAEVVEALLDAARTLMAEQGPGVALRDIAERAGVNFGLIYQYLGTKEQVVREVYARAARGAAERLGEARHVDEALAVLMTLGDGATARLIGWGALDGVQSTEALRDSPALAVLASLVLSDANDAGVDLPREDAQVFAALAMVIALGWRLFGSTALAAAGLEDTRPERYEHVVASYLRGLAAAATHPAPPA